MTAAVSVVGSARATVGGCGWATVVLRPGLPGQFRAPLQLHRSLDRLDALASRSNGLTERSPELAAVKSAANSIGRSMTFPPRR
jgi:hypothetical protein